MPSSVLIVERLGLTRPSFVKTNLFLFLFVVVFVEFVCFVVAVVWGLFILGAVVSFLFLSPLMICSFFVLFLLIHHQ